MKVQITRFMKKAFPAIFLFTLCHFVMADPPTPPAGYKWEVVSALTDEFNDNTINPNKWDRIHPSWNGRIPSEFKPAQSSEGGGYLRLQSKKVPNYRLPGDNSDRWMHSAYVTSKEAIFTTGMYSECKLKASREGMVTGFWFYNAPGNYGNEIDVTEAVGYAVQPQFRYLETKMRTNSHNYIKGPAPNYQWLNDATTPYNHEAGNKVGENFHTYAVWRKNKRDLSFYLNGSLVKNSSNARDMNADLRLIMNTELQNWIGIPPNWALNDNNRNTTYVDFVRTWKLVPCNGGNCGGGQTCSTAPAYSGNANDYSPGDRVVNQDDNRLYERTATGWNFIEQCGGSTDPLTCSTAPAYSGNANDYSPGDRVVNQDDNRLYERTATGWNFIEQCSAGARSAAILEVVEELSISLYPNPVENVLTVSGLSVGSAIQILDLGGRVQYQGVATGTEETISLAKLNAGFYLVKNGSKTLRFVKK